MSGSGIAELIIDNPPANALNLADIAELVRLCAVTRLTTACALCCYEPMVEDSVVAATSRKFRACPDFTEYSARPVDPKSLRLRSTSVRCR